VRSSSLTQPCEIASHSISSLPRPAHELCRQLKTKPVSCGLSAAFETKQPRSSGIARIGVLSVEGAFDGDLLAIVQPDAVEERVARELRQLETLAVRRLAPANEIEAALRHEPTPSLRTPNALPRMALRI
jgi:hypothetical protein